MIRWRTDDRHLELMAVDADRGFTMVGTDPDFRAEDTLTIVASDSGCRVTCRAELVLWRDLRSMSEAQLATAFPSVVAIAEAGLAVFLDP